MPAPTTATSRVEASLLSDLCEIRPCSMPLTSVQEEGQALFGFLHADFLPRIDPRPPSMPMTWPVTQLASPDRR